MSSVPTADDTYGLGETIRVTLTFGEVVDVSGTPRLKIDMDPAFWGEKWVSYERGSGTASLDFVHEVVKPNLSTQGIAVLGEHAGTERRHDTICVFRGRRGAGTHGAGTRPGP